MLISACVLCESSYVTFTMGQTNDIHLSHGQLSYNKVITNSSPKFDSLGFLCLQINRALCFHFFSRAQSNIGTWIDLFKNTKYVCYIFGYTARGNADAGNSVLLHLNEDDTISLKAHPSYSTSIYGTGHVHVYTTFTGKLLNPDKTSTQFLQKTVMQIYENQPLYLYLSYYVTYLV